MQKVIFMVHGLDGGGTQKYVRDMATYMSQQGKAVMVIVVNKSGDISFGSLSDLSFEVSTLKLTGQIKALVSNFEQLIRNWGPTVDAVFANTYDAYRILAEQSFVPINKQYYVIHADYYTMYYRWYRPIKNLKRSLKYRTLYNDRNLVVNSDGVAEHLRDKIGVMPRKMVTIPPPIDCTALIEQSKQPLTDVVLPDNYVVVVGSLTRLKRVDLAIDLLAFLPDDWHLVIVGDGAEKGALSKRARKFFYRVHFTGSLSNPYPVIACSRCLISMSKSEGFSLVLAEAMALGVMPLSVKSVGPSSILSEQFHDCLIEDSNKLLECMSQKILRLPNYDKAMLIEAARQYDVRSVYTKYMSLLG